MLASGMVASCIYIPVHLEGVPVEPPWTAFPLRSWLAEDRVEPRAVVACMDANCPHRVVVGLFRASGSNGEALAAILRDPAPLAASLRAPKAALAALRGTAAGRLRVAPVVTTAETKLLREGALSGFTLAFGRADGAGRAAYGAALGRQAGGAVELVLAVGDDEEAVTSTARRVARENIGR